MKLCAIQLASHKGDLDSNLDRHCYCIEQAAALGARLVVFPELSLTGYEPTLARQLALPLSSARLDPLQALCDHHDITVAVGLPLPTPNGIQIGMPILRPGQPRLSYAKQRLHDDELPFFTPAGQSLVFEVDKHTIAPAICYESMFMAHAEKVRAQGAGLYLVSVAKTVKGIREGYEHYPEVARRLNIPVLMANCIGPADTFIGAGGSAAWDPRGQLLAALDERTQGLVMLDLATGSATALVLPELPA
ncbi:carbon-nitrogen hydrolase family protein [Pseudomonas sp. NyZ480]|uniref:carbon-nitrogen hydrolase family protein n=1 Tax=Pseudomonas sp. NyZ480 TaxID=3035289 RepID=UPI00240A244A|nr:carbon-nitrogen hydrolase family protein [Pseudomonas sp. NyZ480]WEZ86491.1 carbon-nitrogen hydrolase family protein [Pseudomonas sp. NyZ480]